MLYKLTDNELRNLCREKLESLEHWLRRLIDETLSAKYGDYFSYLDSSGNRIIKKDFVDALEERMNREPDRYRRKVDAVLLDDAIDILCKPHLYKFFKPALVGAFPEGRDEARTFLKRLLDPRNRLAHANPISQRQAEQVICYSNDVIDSLKSYYAAVGMQQEYNVPLILKITNSFGNVFYRNNFRDSGWLYKSFQKQPEYFLRPDDILTIEIEVDPAFEPEDYTIRWAYQAYKNKASSFQIIENEARISIEISEQHVGENFSLTCYIRSKKNWHRLGTQGDDKLVFVYKVLPPNE